MRTQILKPVTPALRRSHQRWQISFDSLSTRTYRAEQKNDQAIRILLENETMYCTTHTYVYQRFSKWSSNTQSTEINL